MATLAEAFVKVRPDVAKFGPELKSKTETAAADAGKSSGKSFASSLLKATAVLGGAGLAIGFFKGTLAEGVEAQKVGAQTTAVLKSTGNAAGITATQIGTLATAISNKTGIDDEAIQSTENLLLTFTNLKNGVGAGNDIFNQATQAVTDMSAALGQDGKSSAIQLGKALNDPIKGITALQRVGVSFTDQQKKQIATLVKSGDVLGAQKIILGEVQKEFGGSAAAIATPGDKMKVAWGNLQETIGTKLLPVLAKLMPVLGTVIGFVSDHAGAFAILAGAILAIVAAIKIWNVVQLILNAELFANPIGLVVLAIAALVGGLIYAYNHVKWFRDIVNLAWENIKRATLFLWNNILQPIFHLWVFEIKTVASVVMWLWHHVIQPAIAGIVLEFKLMRTAFTTATQWISDKIVALVSFFRTLPGKISAATKGMFNGISNAFKAAINFIIRGWNSLNFRMPSIDTHIPGIGKIGGFNIGVGHIDQLAAGGIVPATRGGRLVNVGEAGQPEAVAPLSKLVDMIRDAVAAGPRVENLNVRAYSERFSLRQVMDELALHGVT